MIKRIIEAPFRLVGWLFKDTYGRVFAILLLAIVVCLIDYPILDTDVGTWEVLDTISEKASQDPKRSDVDALGKIDRGLVDSREVVRRTELKSTWATMTLPFHRISERQTILVSEQWDDDGVRWVERWEGKDVMRVSLRNPTSLDSLKKALEKGKDLAGFLLETKESDDRGNVRVALLTAPEGSLPRVKDALAAAKLQTLDPRGTGKRKIKHRYVVRTARGLVLGLDLRGGTELTYRLEAPKDSKGVTYSAQEVADVIRKRVDASGLREPRIQPLGEDRILVQIPGSDPSDVARVRDLIARVGRLEFRIVADEQNDEAALREFKKTGKVPTGYHKYILEHEDRAAPGGIRRETVLVIDKPGITGEQIDRANIGFDSKTGTEYAVHVSFRDREAFWRLTSNNVRRRLAIMLDDVRDREDNILAQRDKDGKPVADEQGNPVSYGRIHSAPVINEPILGGAEITGRFTLKSAEDLKFVLVSGSLKVPITPISQETIGPYQGQKAVDASRTACIIGFASVIGFLIIYYLKAGLVASVGLILNLLILVAFMSTKGVTLTLPGIAGILLTVGMADDANVLIFERIREELKKGTERSMLKCMRDGHVKAMSAIIDSNLTTIITAIILYEFGTGPVRGFAVTLGYGLVISLFTSVVIPRILFEAMFKLGWLKSLRMFDAIGVPHIPFVAMRKFWIAASGLAVLASIVWFFTAPGTRFGIEFSSGTLVQVNLKQRVHVDVVRSRLATAARYTDVEVQEFNPTRDGAETFAIRIPRVTTVRVVTTGRVDPAKDPKLGGGAEVVAEINENLAPADVVTQLRAAGAPDCSVTRGPSSGETHTYVIRNADHGPDAVRDLELIVGTAFASEIVTSDIRSALGDLLADEGVKELSRADGKLTARVALAKPAKPEDVEKPVRNVQPAAVVKPEGTLEEGKAAVFLVTAPEDSLPNIKEALKSARLATLEPFGSVEKIQPAVARELGVKAIIAVVLSCLGIIAYMWFRFEFRFGFAAVVALIHDVCIVVGALTLMGHKITLTVIAALLTIIGYSVNDTIVVFDRIRENRKTLRKGSLAETIDISANQTLSRTCLTSLTTLFATLALYFWGGPAIQDFAFAMSVGIVVGTYSSIFIASPILLMMGEQGPVRGPLAVQTTYTARPLQGFRAT